MNEQPVVFVVDDDPAVRGSVELLIKSAGLDPRSFESAEAFLSVVKPDERGCLVCDIDMPGISGLELQEKLQAEGIAIPVVILTGKGSVTSAVRAMKSGAVDFLEKPFDPEQLIEVVQTAMERGLEAAQASDEHREAKSRFKELTPREREVFGLVVAGNASKVVAAELGISERTVEVHRSRVMSKMAVRSVAELALLAALVK